jgi:hypothetical protein
MTGIVESCHIIIQCQRFHMHLSCTTYGQITVDPEELFRTCLVVIDGLEADLNKPSTNDIGGV